MHVVQRVPRRVQRRMHSPYERVSINGAGLGDLDGMFNIGKMFTRMFTIKKSSFKFKNIAGAIGSAAMTVGTGGMANIASEIAGPSGLKLTKGSITGAHSKVSKIAGYATMAAAAVAGAVVAAPVVGGALGIGGVAATGTGLTAAGTTVAGTAAASGGFFATAGSVLSTVGSGLMTAMKALPILGTVMGGMGGKAPQQGGMTQAEYDAMQMQAQQQAEYDAQVRQQQGMLYNPGGQPISYIPETGFVQQPSGQYPSMNTSYGDLRSPYTAITEDGQQVQVDPATGQVIQPGIPTEWMIGIGGVAAIGLGLYLFSGSKSTN